MASAESKIDVVLNEVKNLTIGQLKLTTIVDELHKRSIEATKTSVDLATELKNLTSRLEVLETLSKPPPKAPSREEEERAKGHHKHHDLHGGGVQGPVPHHSLGKCEFKLPNFDMQSSRDRDTLNLHTSNNREYSRDYKLPKVDFPKFDGEHPPSV